MKDREVASTRCPRCHLPAKRKIRWFVNNSKSYESVSMCQEHGFVKGKIRLRKTDEGCYYAVKTLKNVGKKKRRKSTEKGIPSAKKKNENLRREDLKTMFSDNVWQFLPGGR